MTRWFNITAIPLHRPWKHERRHHRRTLSEIISTDRRYVQQYRLLHEIGCGSTGVVHLAVDKKTNLQYVIIQRVPSLSSVINADCTPQAIKELSKSRLQRQQRNDFLRLAGPKPCFGLGVTAAQESLGSENKRRRLVLSVSEAEILKQLNHPNIVRLVQTIDDPDGDSVYLGTYCSLNR